MIKILSLPDAFDLLSGRAVKAVRESGVVLLQSERAGCAQGIRGIAKEVHTLDDLFERAEDFDALYEEGARRAAALADGQDVTFCVIGDVFENGFVRALTRNGAQLEFIDGAGTVDRAVFLAARHIGAIGG
ncbi:MAG TPA: hypothetical protein DEB31_00240, partial [Clostridiales bacterium]|nr:hypothetical protein [Clostridiales bacterium]